MNPELSQDLSLLQLVIHASLPVQIVMLLLLGASLMSWWFIFIKLFALKRALRMTDQFEHEFWAGGDINAMYERVAAERESAGEMERIFAAGAPILLLVSIAVGGCSAFQRASTAPTPAAKAGTIAQVYYWRAKSGRFDEYTRYVRDVAEPIDAEAERNGAFLTVTTFMTRDTTSAWTHMRVFVLRDSTQLRELSAKLDAAGVKLEPDSVKRRLRGEYSATLRDRVGAQMAHILY